MENTKRKKAVKMVGWLTLLALAFYVGFILLVTYR